MEIKQQKQAPPDKLDEFSEVTGGLEWRGSR